MFNPDPQFVERILNDTRLRREITRESFQWFFYIYFSHYITYPIAPFHEEIFSFIENEKIRNLIIVAFRGSAKSTIITLAYVLWGILGKQNKKNDMLMGMTQQQSRQLLKNIKIELEKNNLLRTDLGPFKEEEDEWRSFSLVLPYYGARITAISSEQSVRGLREQQHRPDLIICDDIEDLRSVNTRESRDKTYAWVKGDVLPSGDKNTRTIFVGNLLHEDSLMMRLKKEVESDILDGTFRMYPLVDANDKCTWPGKYPNQEDIESEKERVGDLITFEREYMLRIISDEGRVVHPEWIHYGDEPTVPCRAIFTGVDLAISEEEKADYTAMVSVKVYGHGDDFRIVVLPNPINKRMSFPDTIECAKKLSYALGDNKQYTKLVVEDVAYQRACIQTLEKDGIPVEAFSPAGSDKRSKLSSIAGYIKNGTIIFTKGTELLVQQVTGFGTERHDDLNDAFVIAALRALQLKAHNGVIFTGVEKCPLVPGLVNIRKKQF